MKRFRSRKSVPELIVRSFLHTNGFSSYFNRRCLAVRISARLALFLGVGASDIPIDPATSLDKSPLPVGDSRWRKSIRMSGAIRRPGKRRVDVQKEVCEIV